MKRIVLGEGTERHKFASILANIRAKPKKFEILGRIGWQKNKPHSLLTCREFKYKVLKGWLNGFILAQSFCQS
jgi:hypothetical protein